MNKIKVLVKSVSDTDGVENIINTAAVGSYSETNGKFRVTYIEKCQETGAITNVELLITPKQLEVHRSGSVNLDLALQLGKKSFTKYVTQYGTFDITVSVSKLDIAVDNNCRGTINCAYNLDIKGLGVNKNRLAITLQKGQ